MQDPAPPPTLSSVPPRNPGLLGRDHRPSTLRDRMRSRSRTVVPAPHGWGGVGKTQLVIENAHRFAADYDIAWWIDAERPELIADELAALAVAADLATVESSMPDAVAALNAHLRSHGPRTVAAGLRQRHRAGRHPAEVEAEFAPTRQPANPHRTFTGRQLDKAHD